MTNDEIIKSVKDRFVWETDGKLDSYHILASEGPIYGDCDDFAVTVLYELVGHNILKFWWWLITFKACLWFVTSVRGGPHVVLWVRGSGYTDNFRESFSPTENLHKKRFPILWPIVAFKLLLGKFVD